MLTAAVLLGNLSLQTLFTFRENFDFLVKTGGFVMDGDESPLPYGV